MQEAINIIIWPWFLWLILVMIHAVFWKSISKTLSGIYIGLRLGLLCAILMELIYVAGNVYR